jgi:hypothetical protein
MAVITCSRQLGEMSVRITPGTASYPQPQLSRRLGANDRPCIWGSSELWSRTARLALLFTCVARPYRVYDLRCAIVPRLRLNPRKSGNAAENMELDCTHDGGVTEPLCRTFGWVSDTRQHGSGVQRKPLWDRQLSGSLPHVHESRGCHFSPHQSPVLLPPAVASVGRSGISFTCA